MKENLNNKTVWITGASSGIGASAAEKLTETKAKLILSASQPKSFAGLKDTFRDRPNAYFMPFEISGEEKLNAIYEKIENIAGGVDILINNAGIAEFGPFAETTLEQFDRMFAINLRGMYMCTKKVLPRMLKNKFGIIINISSNAALKTFPNSSVYAATKAAQRAMTRSLREEIRSEGVKIIDIYPGATATGIWPEDVLAEKSHKMMSSADIGEVIFKSIELSLSGSMMVEEIVVRPQGGDL
jgi:short-subunit dehydrogenase